MTLSRADHYSRSGQSTPFEHLFGPPGSPAMSNEKLRQLEEKVEALVRASRRVRERYQASLTRESSLREERAELLRKNDLARAKVEAIITRLKELEQE